MPLAADSNALTAWETDAYATADLGGIKPGVGLKVTLDAPATVTSVRLQSTTPGANVQILGPGDDTSGGRPVLGQGSLASGETTIPVTTSAPISELVVWLTELPKSRTGEFPYCGLHRGGRGVGGGEQVANGPVGVVAARAGGTSWPAGLPAAGARPADA